MILMGLLRKFAVFAVLALSVTIFGAANTVTAQTVDELRALLSREMSDGHSRIGYSATYNALAKLHEDPNTVDNVILFYTGRSQRSDKRVNQDAHNGWNREHLWPQSHGSRREPMKSDLHHLKPTDATVNGRRGSLDFDTGGDAEGEAPDTFLDGNSFEPRDEVKGNVARAIFYMDVRYEGRSGEPDLVLVPGQTGSGTTLGKMCVLLKWHNDDPVSDEERARNQKIREISGQLECLR